MALQRAGQLTYLVSQNVDGLHLRSGIPRAALAELHGNCFAERCHACGAEYIRDFEIETVGFKRTGRKCSQVRALRGWWAGNLSWLLALHSTLLALHSTLLQQACGLTLASPALLAPAAGVQRSAAGPHPGLVRGQGCIASTAAGLVVLLLGWCHSFP